MSCQYKAQVRCQPRSLAGFSTTQAGLGTEEAGANAGTQYGVAKKANLVAVRVYSCNSIGDFALMIAAFEWVVANAIRPAVITLDIEECDDPETVQLIQNLVNAQETAFVASVAVLASTGN